MTQQQKSMPTQPGTTPEKPVEPLPNSSGAAPSSSTQGTQDSKSSSLTPRKQLRICTSFAEMTGKQVTAMDCRILIKLSALCREFARNTTEPRVVTSQQLLIKGYQDWGPASLNSAIRAITPEIIKQLSAPTCPIFFAAGSPFPNQAFDFFEKYTSFFINVQGWSQADIPQETFLKNSLRNPTTSGPYSSSIPGNPTPTNPIPTILPLIPFTPPPYTYPQNSLPNTWNQPFLYPVLYPVLYPAPFILFPPQTSPTFSSPSTPTNIPILTNPHPIPSYASSTYLNPSVPVDHTPSSQQKKRGPETNPINREGEAKRSAFRPVSQSTHSFFNHPSSLISPNPQSGDPSNLIAREGP